VVRGCLHTHIKKKYPNHVKLVSYRLKAKMLNQLSIDSWTWTWLLSGNEFGAIIKVVVNIL
jgi:hypothetical protein